MKTKKPLTRAQLISNAYLFLDIPKSWILDVVPNCGKTAYFVHWSQLQLNGKAIIRTTLISKETLEA